MAAPVALPFVGVQPHAASRTGFGDAGTARPRVCMVAHPPALLSRVARDAAAEGGRSWAEVPCPLRLLVRRRGV